MAIRSSSSSGIPFGNTAGRPTAVTGQPYFNGETGRLELYTSTGWQNIVQETPGIASITGTYNESAGSGTFIISGTNFVTGGIAYAVGTNGVEYQATTSTINSIVQMTAVFTALSPAYEPYDVKVLNPSNLFGLLPDAFYINDNPIWTTSSGSLGTFNCGSSVSLQLAATDDESNTISYSISSGSLPGGLSLSSNGLISGTLIAVSGTSNFIVSASDGYNTGQTRSFSIISVAPAVTGGTLSSDSTYYYRTFTGSGNLVVSNANLNVEILTIAGGGGGGGCGPTNARYGGAGGGAGGIVYTSSSSYSPQTYSIQIGAGGAGGTGAVSTGNGTQGINSQFASLTAAVGGGYGGSDQGPYGSSGGNGGSGGGGGTAFSAPNGYGGTGVVGQGNNGGNGAPNNGGGGGGGAGSVGSIGTTSGGGNGGSGLNTYSSWATATSTGASGYYCSGGGGGIYQSGTPGSASAGGGGNGASLTNNGTSGTALTGGGGGGASGTGAATTGGTGGSGLVIVRYTKASVGG